MKVIITEDIVRNALNESIDEFMLEEGMINEWGGSAIKKLFNPIKNAAAMYMDWRTNGRWNRKYGIQASGNGFAVGYYYLKKWLKMHYNRLYDIIWGNYYGNRQYFFTKINNKNESFTHDWRTNSYFLTYYDRNAIYRLKLDKNNVPNSLSVEDNRGVKIEDSTGKTDNPTNGSYEFEFRDRGYDLTIYSDLDNTTPEVYVMENCTPYSFNIYTQNKLGDGDFKTAVGNYLLKIQEINNKNIAILKRSPNAKINYNELLKMFTISNFYKNYQPNQKQKKQPYDNQPNIANGSYDNSYYNYQNDTNYYSNDTNNYGKGYESDELNDADFDV